MPRREMFKTGGRPAKKDTDQLDELATDRCKIESHNLWIKSGFGHALSALVPCTLDHAL